MKPEHTETLHLMFAGKPIPEPIRIATEAAEAALNRAGGSQLSVQALCGVIGGVDLLKGGDGILGASMPSKAISATVASMQNGRRTAERGRCPNDEESDQGDHQCATMITHHAESGHCGSISPGTRVRVAHDGLYHEGTVIEGVGDNGCQWRVSLDDDLLGWRRFDVQSISQL